MLRIWRNTYSDAYSDEYVFLAYTSIFRHIQAYSRKREYDIFYAYSSIFWHILAYSRIFCSYTTHISCTQKMRKIIQNTYSSIFWAYSMHILAYSMHIPAYSRVYGRTKSDTFGSGQTRMGLIIFNFFD